MQRDDHNPGVRKLVAKTIKRIDYSEEKAAEALRLLKLEKYTSVKEYCAACDAVEDVQKHCGVNAALIRQFTRWTLVQGSRRTPPCVPETSGFYEYGVGTLRIAMPVIKEAIEGKDEKMRAAGLELLAIPIRLPHYSAWYACPKLVGFLESTNPAVRRATARKLADVRKRISESWLPRHPMGTVAPQLRKAWFKEKDTSVATACREALEAFKPKGAKR
jgi:hypothetical protein